MALNHSPEFQSVIVQIICFLEFHFESACALLINTTLGTTCHAKFYAFEASGSEEEDFNISLCISWFEPRTP